MEGNPFFARQIYDAPAKRYGWFLARSLHFLPRPLFNAGLPAYPASRVHVSKDFTPRRKELNREDRNGDAKGAKKRWEYRYRPSPCARKASRCGKASRRGSPPRRGRGWVYLYTSRDMGISAETTHCKRDFRGRFGTGVFSPGGDPLVTCLLEVNPPPAPPRRGAATRRLSEMGFFAAMRSGNPFLVRTAPGRSNPSATPGMALLGAFPSVPGPLLRKNPENEKKKIRTSPIPEVNRTFYFCVINVAGLSADTCRSTASPWGLTMRFVTKPYFDFVPPRLCFNHFLTRSLALLGPGRSMYVRLTIPSTFKPLCG